MGTCRRRGNRVSAEGMPLLAIRSSLLASSYRNAAKVRTEMPRYTTTTFLWSSQFDSGGLEVVGGEGGGAVTGDDESALSGKSVHSGGYERIQ